MCCAHIIEGLFYSEASVTVLGLVSDSQSSLKVLQHLFAQLPYSLWIGWHV